LVARIGAEKPSKRRPIVGKTTDPHEMLVGVNEFLLAPLLLAEEIGAIPKLPEILALDGGTKAYSAETTGLMSQLGRFWRATLTTFLSGSTDAKG
jgi:hypothetical protein